VRPAFRHRARPGLLAALCAGVLLGACATARPSPEGTSSESIEATVPRDSLSSLEPIDLRVVYLIHGDADYSFHDSLGNRLLADREAVKQAREVGRRAQRTEVFIFHQIASKPRLFEKAQKAGNYYHYRSGVMLQRTSYYRAEGPYLEAEAALLRRDADSAKAFTVVAYFGHEIPLTERKGYFASDPDQEFSVARFARGLGHLDSALNASAAPREKPFDLTILSMCYGGAPAVMQALSPLSKRVIASPAYLHLSYLDTRALGNFTADYARNLARHTDEPYTDRDMRVLADSIAAQSFLHLKSKTQTEITVGIYEADSLKPFLAPYAAFATPRIQGVWKDCAEAPAFDARKATRGVKLYYQPPRFGPLQGRQARSAWQCLL
jgi:hypothetical protein